MKNLSKVEQTIHQLVDDIEKLEEAKAQVALAERKLNAKQIELSDLVPREDLRTWILCNGIAFRVNKYCELEYIEVGFIVPGEKI